MMYRHHGSVKKKIAVGILGILTAISTISGCGKTDQLTTEEKAGKGEQENAVVYIGDCGVPAEEYAMLARMYANQIMMSYDTDQVNRETFWETEIDGIPPWSQLQDVIEEELKYHYTLRQLALDLGVTESYTFETLMSGMDAENTERQDKTAEGAVVYGLTEYDAEKYYKYWYSNLEMSVQNALIREKTNVSESDCRAFYDTHKEAYVNEGNILVLCAEVSGENAMQTADAIARSMEQGAAMEELQTMYPAASMEELQLASGGQESLSSVADTRWQIASALQDGEISIPYEENGTYVVIQCLEHLPETPIEYEDVRGRIERALQAEQAAQMIEKCIEETKVTKGQIEAKTVILDTLQRK